MDFRTVGVAVAAATFLSFGPAGVAPASASEVVQETGVVTFISDGDTVSVDVAGDGTRVPVRVRFAAIQATEDYHQGERGSYNHCHSLEAAAALSRLVLGKQVQLRSPLKSMTASDGVRLVRTVWVQQNGALVDVGRRQLERGHAFWYGNYAFGYLNRDYQRAAAQARAAGLNIWDTDHCGVGPSAGAKLGVSLVWDAAGDDRTNVNGEYVKVKNYGSATVDLSGWKIRDNTIHHEFRFPGGTTLAPGRSLTLHVGKGINTLTSFYWGYGKPLFGNSTVNGYGEGAYLLDPQDDFRAWFEYPCIENCADPNAGKLRIVTAVYDPPGVDSDNPNGEYVRIKNVGTTTVRLSDYSVFHSPYYYRLSSYLRPGETLRLHTGSGDSTRRVRYWGFDRSIYRNTGERVELLNVHRIRLDCYAWGAAVC